MSAALSVITRARALLTPPGAWSARRGEGMLLIEALFRARGAYSRAAQKAFADATRIVCAAIETDVMSVTEWELTPGRTQADVLALLDRVADELRGRG